MSRKLEKQVTGTIDRVLQDRFAHILEDISFRIGQAYDVANRVGAGIGEGKVYAEDLHLPGRALITGYTTTPNTPAAGSFAWADVHMVYNGVDNAVANGSTAMKYVWWSPTTTPLVFQTSATKPNLLPGEVLVFMNEGGTPRLMLSDTNASMPKLLANDAVDTGSIIANAVGSTEIADGAIGRGGQLANNVIGAGKVADGAINRSGILGPNTVGAGAVADGAVNRSTQLGTNVVGSGALADGAVNRAGQLVNNVVGAGKLADGAINRSTILGGNTVTNAALADGAVNRAAQLAANVVTNTQIADNAVRSNSIQMSAVTQTEIAPGAVSPVKLNILRHIMF